jgi:hypothetical protein
MGIIKFFHLLIEPPTTAPIKLRPIAKKNFMLGVGLSHALKVSSAVLSFSVWLPIHKPLAELQPLAQLVWFVMIQFIWR